MRRWPCSRDTGRCKVHKSALQMVLGYIKDLALTKLTLKEDKLPKSSTPPAAERPGTRHQTGFLWMTRITNKVTREYAWGN